MIKAKGRAVCVAFIENLRMSLASTRFRLASTFSTPFRGPDITTLPGCITFLKSFAENFNLSKGKELHTWMLKRNFLSDPQSVTSLINMYSKCNHSSQAVSVFESLGDPNNVYACNAIIAGFVGNNLYDEGFNFYLDMRSRGVSPDKFTFPCVIKGCSDPVEIRKIHALLFKYGLDLDPYIGSTLINSYVKFKAIIDAYNVFDSVRVRDVVLCNSMITGFVHIGEFKLALEVFRMMNKGEVAPNNFSIIGCLSAFSMSGDLENGSAMHGLAIKKGYESALAVSNALIDMYGKCKCLDDALLIFSDMEQKDIFSWNTILTVHQQCGDYRGTIDFLQRMLYAGMRPDLVTITTVLPAYASLSVLLHVKEIHRYMIANGMGSCRSADDFENLKVNNVLLDVYVKCGSMKYANQLFNSMTIKDVASWNIMIVGYGTQGQGSEALSMFDRMCADQIAPDEITFVGVLSACSHSGFLRRGREYLSLMESVYGVVPTIEHYACVVDMLGRAGLLDEAYELVVTLPIQSNDVAWRCFLSACSLHGNSRYAKIAAEKLLELDRDHCGSYVLMSNIYGASGRYDEVSDVRLTMRGQNIKKKPGCSWIELNKVIHCFGTRDRDHPQANSIYDSVDSLTALCAHGYTLSV